MDYSIIFWQALCLFYGWIGYKLGWSKGWKDRCDIERQDKENYEKRKNDNI